MVAPVGLEPTTNRYESAALTIELRPSIHGIAPILVDHPTSVKIGPLWSRRLAAVPTTSVQTRPEACPFSRGGRVYWGRAVTPPRPELTLENGSSRRTPESPPTPEYRAASCCRQRSPGGTN